jgi:D-glycero-alpha-D-manno-heptose 1-phosphate guanylyltransferase
LVRLDRTAGSETVPLETASARPRSEQKVRDWRCLVNDGMKNTKAVLLVGGLGTRLRSVLPSTPKPMARVGKRPFLELLIRQLGSHGIRRLVMCTGYLGDEIEKDFGNGSSFDVSIEYSKENSPLGTAGAIKHAAPLLDDVDHFFVANGDSFMEADFQQLLEIHCRAGVLLTMAVTRLRNQGRYGTVETLDNGLVSAFLEKTSNQEIGLVNTGIYVFDRKLLSLIPDGPCSLEKDVFPVLLPRGVRAVEQSGIFIDIGIPEDYARAQEMAEALYRAAADAACRDQGNAELRNG